MIVTPKYSRRYNTGFRAFANQECDVPVEVFERYPSHFVIKMVGKAPEKIEKIIEPVKQEVKQEKVKKITVKKSK